MTVLLMMFTLDNAWGFLSQGIAVLLSFVLLAIFFGQLIQIIISMACRLMNFFKMEAEADETLPWDMTLSHQQSRSGIYQDKDVKLDNLDNSKSNLLNLSHLQGTDSKLKDF
jgi:hypothetical protein